jgi:glycine/D-amino acid oxidase-like deaminating enzyme
MALAHTAHGWWQEEAGDVTGQPPLRGSFDADIVIVGGGYSGLWAAWFLTEREPGTRIAVLEAERCGTGPSGRNGGFVNAMWSSLPTLRRRFGDAAGLAVARASQEAVDGIGRWCREQGVDAWFRTGGYMQTSTTPAHDDTVKAAAEACTALGVPEACGPLTGAQARERCGSPLFKSGAFYPGAATVQPARLAWGLRSRILDRGVAIFEGSRAQRLRVEREGVEVETVGGRVRARSAVLAAGSALAGWRGLRRRLTLTSSHMLITEPVPDVLEELGWTDGECITDSRAMVHYFRTTPDGRIAFGWGGGRVVRGARVGGRAEVDPGVVAQLERHLVRFFPALAGRRIEHAWGGPIDVSPTHQPVIGSLESGRVHYAFGYTGNGVGPSHLAGRVLASLALDRRDDETRLAIVDPPEVRVPPEPLRYVGGRIVRAALVRRERFEEEGRAPGPVTRLVAGLPERIGIHIGR